MRICLVSIPKLSLYIVKVSLILKNKSNIFESILYPSPKPSNHPLWDSSQLIYKYNYNCNCNLGVDRFNLFKLKTNVEKTSAY